MNLGRQYEIQELPTLQKKRGGAINDYFHVISLTTPLHVEFLVATYSSHTGMGVTLPLFHKMGLRKYTSAL